MRGRKTASAHVTGGPIIGVRSVRSAHLGRRSTDNDQSHEKQKLQNPSREFLVPTPAYADAAATTDEGNDCPPIPPWNVPSPKA